MNLPMNWVPVILVCLILACSGFVFGFVFFDLFCVFAVCLVYDDDGPMDLLYRSSPSSLLRLSTVDGLEH